VDLGLEIPAVCIGAATVLGSLWGDPRRHGAREAARPRGVWALGAGVAVVGAGITALGLYFGLHDVGSDRSDLQEAIAARPPPAPAVLRADLERAMLRHPAEPYFPLIGALVALRARDQSPIPWLQRTLERGRVNGPAHFLLAQVLAGRGSRPQALLELRLAVEDDPLLVGPASELAVRWARTFDDLLVAVPEGREGDLVLIEMGRLFSTASAVTTGGAQASADLGGRCDREAIARDPRAIAPRVREAEARLAALAQAGPSPLCGDHAHCREEILEHADAIAAAEPDSVTALSLRARVLLVEGKIEEAVKLLEAECERVSDRVSCLQQRVSAAARLKAAAPMTSASKDLLGAACVTNTACADAATWLASVRLNRSEPSAALALLTRAAREDPSDESRWMRVADAATQAGAHVQAVEALEKVAKHRGGADPELRQRIDQEHRAALGGLLVPMPR
jgi:hypothetical protein